MREALSARYFAAQTFHITDACDPITLSSQRPSSTQQTLLCKKSIAGAGRQECPIKWGTVLHDTVYYVTDQGDELFLYVSCYISGSFARSAYYAAVHGVYLVVMEWHIFLSALRKYRGLWWTTTFFTMNFGLICLWSARSTNRIRCSLKTFLKRLLHRCIYN